MIALLGMALHAAVPPVPREVGFLPPMAFSCRTGEGTALLSGRISPVRIDSGGFGLFRTADAANTFKDRLLVEIKASPLPDLSGSYEVVAVSPADIDKMAIQLPQKGAIGYSLTLYSPASGTGGYPRFTHLLVERRNSSGARPAAGPSVWFASCTTTPPAEATPK